MKLEKKMVSVGTQTGDTIEFYAHISPTKHVHLRWSERLADYVVELTFSNLKKYIIRREEWKKFKNHFTRINYVFNC